MGAGRSAGRQRSPDTRARLVQAAAGCLQRQGYEGTSIKRILTEADATFSSLYHFFPGGKEELAAAAVRHGAQDFADTLRAGLSSSPDPADAVAACALRLAENLRASDWADGCPVAAAALETVGRSPVIQGVADEVLRDWRGLIAAKLVDGGFAEGSAAGFACTVLSVLEGAELLSRVSADDEPLRLAATHLAALIRTCGETDGRPASGRMEAR